MLVNTWNGLPGAVVAGEMVDGFKLVSEVMIRMEGDIAIDGNA